MLRDLQSGLRQLVRRPGFAAAAMFSLALGIGLNTTLFSVVNAVLLRDNPLARPDRLVEIYTGLSSDYPHLTTSYPDYRDIERGADALAGVAASAYVRGILSAGDRSALVTGEAVSSNYFDLLGINVPLGRPFRTEENRAPGAAPVVVLGHALWQTRFGGRPDIIGARATLSGLDYTIVGVAPRGFTGTLPGIPTELWVPLMMVEQLEFSGVQTTADIDPGATRLDRRGTRWLFLKGRLADGRTIDEAQAQIGAIFSRLSLEHPNTNAKVTAAVLPAADIRFHPLLDGYVKAASAALLVAMGLILLIACANVANLLLARATSRRREFAVRAALGASRARIVRQLLIEGLVLSIAGGGLGLLIAWWAGQALSGVGTDVFPMPIHFEFSIDRAVLLFALAVSAATTVLFALAPAWRASKPELVPVLKDAAGGQGRARLTLSDGLVVGQLALSLVLLVAGALLGRGLLTARNTDLGYDPGPIASLSFNLKMNGYDVDRAEAFADRALDTLRALPGVIAVSTASRLPLAPDINIEGILVPGHHRRGDDETPVDAVLVGADYFTAVDVPIVAGRAFTPIDVAERRRVAIVNETMARQYWPGASAVGRVIYSGSFETEPYEIVGVARDHKVRSVGEAPRPYLHRPGGHSQAIGLIVRTTTPAEAALPMLRRTLWEMEPAIVFTEDAPAARIAETTLAPTRIGATALAVFGALALLLAAVGLYGVMAYSVSMRTREIGIRVALGAERGRVLRMVLLKGVKLALLGGVLGAAAAAAVANVLRSLLYGVSAFDAAAYGGAMGILALVAFLANLVPALTAARVDPAVSLRSE